jgi:hypothetical protein
MPFSRDGMFYHRQHPDGTWVSICLRCLRTAACDLNDWNLLAQAEAGHTCDPATVVRIQKKRTEPRS